MTMATRRLFCFFGQRAKIVEIFALLPTEISIYKVGMLFCIQWVLI